MTPAVITASDQFKSLMTRYGLVFLVGVAAGAWALHHWHKRGRG